MRHFIFPHTLHIWNRAFDPTDKVHNVRLSFTHHRSWDEVSHNPDGDDRNSFRDEVSNNPDGEHHNTNGQREDLRPPFYWERFSGT